MNETELAERTLPPDSGVKKRGSTVMSLRQSSGNIQPGVTDMVLVYSSVGDRLVRWWFPGSGKRVAQCTPGMTVSTPHLA